MIDFDPISADAARKAVDHGVYGQPEHRRIEERMRAGRPGVPTADTTPESTGGDCRIVEVDGEAIRVQASGEWDAEDHAAFAEIVRAAKAHMRDEQIGES